MFLLICMFKNFHNIIFSDSPGMEKISSVLLIITQLLQGQP